MGRVTSEKLIIYYDTTSVFYFKFRYCTYVFEHLNFIANGIVHDLHNLYYILNINEAHHFNSLHDFSLDIRIIIICLCYERDDIQHQR